MEIKQSDRDNLRASQQKLNSQVIGNIVEHKTQNPRRYKDLSIQEQNGEQSSLTNNGSPKSWTTKIKLDYKSKFLEVDPKKPIISNIRFEDDLPIKPSDIQANSWLNMDTLEYDKLEWLSEHYKRSNHDKNQQSLVTKFSKDGLVIPNVIVKEAIKQNIHKTKMEVDVVKKQDELENDDQNYDINGLIDLLASTYQRQSTYSLIVIRKIANLANDGFYDGTFDENILSILIKNCLLRIRSHMDSSDETTCLNALKCVKSLLCNTEIDEMNLDRIHPVICDNLDPNIWLQSQISSKIEFNEEMKDHECVEIDPILALIERTNIIQRIAYLLRVKNTYDYYTCILDVLIRLARHSRKVCSILNNSGLLYSITSIFLPSSITTKTENIRNLSFKALKLIRIICQASMESEIVGDKETKFDKLPEEFMSSIQTYFFIDCYNTPLDCLNSFAMLYMESLRIIKILSRIKIYSTKMLDLMALGQSNLYNSCKALTSLKVTNQMEPKISAYWQIAAHLIDLIGHYKVNTYDQGKLTFVGIFIDKYISICLLQWINDIIIEKCIPHFDVSITITTAFKHLNDSMIDSPLSGLIIMDTVNKKNNDYFKALIREAHDRSYLADFTKFSGNLRDPSMLPSYGTLNFNTTDVHEFKLSPILDKNSPFLLLNMFITKLQEAEIANSFHFINDISFLRYIKRSTSYYNQDRSYEIKIHASSIAQYEVKLLSNLLLLLVRYYLDYTDASIFDEDGNTIEELDEPSEFEIVRQDCYSNISHYAIGLIGLLNSTDPHSYTMKVKLLENILLNSKLQFRLTKENFKKRSRCRDPIKLWQDIAFRDFIGGDKQFFQLEKEHYLFLLPLYKSLVQTDRYWIFQPILMYYSNQICIDDKNPKEKDDRWFDNNIQIEGKTGQLAYSTDAKVLNVVLDFHFTMLIYCPSYSLTTVKPNVEDYLCLVGCLFLHDDIFLDEDLNFAIRNNIRMILNDCLSESDGKFRFPFRDASKKIGPLENLPLADFFNKLIDQFESVSYGDITFANFLLLFIAPPCDITFRRKLFQERTDTCLSVFNLAIDDLWSPKEIFFTTKESDPEMIIILKKARAYIPRSSFLQDYVRYHTQN